MLCVAPLSGDKISPVCKRRVAKKTGSCVVGRGDAAAGVMRLFRGDYCLGPISKMSSPPARMSAWSIYILS